LQHHCTLLQVKKVSFEHIFIAVFGSSISSTLFISETNISLCFFSQVLLVFKRYPQDLASIMLAIAKHHVVSGPAPTMVIKVDCCRGVVEATFSS